MKKSNHPVDDLFREALRDHRITPSSKARQAFLKDALLQKPPPANRKRGFILLSLFVIFSVMTGIIWMLATHTSNPSPAEQVKPSARIGAVVKTSPAISSESFIDDQRPSGTSSSGISKNPEKPGPTQASAAAINKPVTENETATPLRPIGEHVELPGSTANKVYPTMASKLPADTSLPAIIQQEKAMPANDRDAMVPTVPAAISTGMENHDSTINNNKEKPKPSNRLFFPEVGFSYTPGWMFNTLEGSNFVHHFGLELVFHYGQFVIRTGAGLSVSKGTNELIVEYNDYLGNYNQLDSMNFAWSEPAHNYVPTIYSSKKDIWDSLVKFDSSKVVKRYTYLQFPLVLGYDFIKRDRICFGLRVGPVLSVLVATKQLSAAYDPGTKQVVSMNDISPGQISLNWQLMAGLPVGIRLSNRFSLEVEPEARYYFNSAFEKPAGDYKPWSIGLRTAFLMKL